MGQSTLVPFMHKHRHSLRSCLIFDDSARFPRLHERLLSALLRTAFFTHSLRSCLIFDDSTFPGPWYLESQNSKSPRCT